MLVVRQEASWDQTAAENGNCAPRTVIGTRWGPTRSCRVSFAVSRANAARVSIELVVSTSRSTSRVQKRAGTRQPCGLKHGRVKETQGHRGLRLKLA